MSFFVPGLTRNLLNASRLHWTMRAEYHKAWRAKVKLCALQAGLGAKRGSTESKIPKLVRLHAHIWNRYDPHSLCSILKPTLDALVDTGLLHADNADAIEGFDGKEDPAKHKILYSQEVNRRQPGVEIAVSLR